MKLLIIMFILGAAWYLYSSNLKGVVPTDSDIPLNCILVSNGCNQCFAKKGKLLGCTKDLCLNPKTPECIKYE